MLVYTTALTTQQRLLNEAYLYGKWLALAPNYLPDMSAVVVAEWGHARCEWVDRSHRVPGHRCRGSTAASVQLGTGGTLIAGSNNATTTYAGTISGAGALVKAGTGHEPDQSPPTAYTGATTVRPVRSASPPTAPWAQLPAARRSCPAAALVLDNVAYTNLEPLTLSGTGRGGTGPLLAQTGLVPSPGRHVDSPRFRTSLWGKPATRSRPTPECGFHCRRRRGQRRCQLSQRHPYQHGRLGLVASGPRASTLIITECRQSDRLLRRTPGRLLGFSSWIRPSPAA